MLTLVELLQLIYIERVNKSVNINLSTGIIRMLPDSGKETFTSALARKYSGLQ